MAPSAAPVALAILHDERELPCREEPDGEGGSRRVALLEGHPAGAPITGLELLLLDGGGGPARQASLALCPPV